MKRALILYNPASGQRHRERAARVDKALQVLRTGGVDAEAAPTRAAGSAPEQAREAVAAGFDTIIAGGGDGTINEVLQGMIGSTAALGVLPLGTANALANDLALPRDPERCARTLLEWVPRAVPAGVMQTGDESAKRYFTVMAGVGADARLVYVLSAPVKQKLGMAAYFAHGWFEYLFYHYAPFQAEVRVGEDRSTHSVAQVMAVRLANLGFPLRRLAPGADITSPRLRIVLMHKAVRVTYPALLSSAFLGAKLRIPGVEVLDADEVICTPLPHVPADHRVYGQTDGEIFGQMPIRLGIVPDAFRLLMPKQS